MMNASTDDVTTNGIDSVNSGSGDNGPSLIRRATFDTSVKPSSSSSSKRRGSASGWGLVKQSVNEPKTDLWNAIFDAVGGDKEEHRNDKNDLKSSFTFKEFRRELSFLRRSTSQETDDNDNVWCDDGDSQDSEDIEDELLTLPSQEEDDIIEVKRSGTRIDRRKSSLVKSIRRENLYRSSKTLSSSLAPGEMEELLQLTNDEARKEWARSFYHLDPRWQILTFFNDLALEGAGNLEQSDGIILEDKKLEIPFLLRVFARAGVFSVWRPTSNEAIRYMMTGEGVGKGLDIKGKSALKGKYSGFVPFMQIHDNNDKDKIKLLSSTNRVRIFWPNQSSRDRAEVLLKPLRDMMMNKANDSLKVIEVTEEVEAQVLKYAMQRSFKSSSSNTSKTMKLVAQESRRMFSTAPMQKQQEQFENALVDKSDNLMACGGSILKIDDHEAVYGLEVPEKLFWKAFVERNDITRDEETKTGRKSMYEFQVMNLETLRKKQKISKSLRKLSLSEPKPVLYHAGCGSKQEPLEDANPLCPLGLLMAYEEEGDTTSKVTPVVSDFDCFLVGTRGVEFTEPLAQTERDMLSSCVDDIEGILEKEQGVSWTTRWLEVKKKRLRDGFALEECKRFGYADPKSYTMMKGAVHRLRDTGAVRHGPECFNYSFPQELDDKFLVISDTLEGKVPWKYVDSNELIDILSERVDEGFTFPMNPAWILTNPNFKELYDKLIASDKPNVRESMACWYPKEIQQRIHNITSKYPEGFVSYTKPSRDRTSGNSCDLAQMELSRYNVRRKGQSKLRRALTRQRLKKNKTPTLFSTTLMMLQFGKESEVHESRQLSMIADKDCEVDDQEDKEMPQDMDKKLPRRSSKSLASSNKGSKRRSFAEARRASLDRLVKPIKRALSSRKSKSQPDLDM